VDKQGSLAGRKSFAVYRADYLNQVHANRIKGVYRLAGNSAVEVPRKNGVRMRDIDGSNYAVVRTGISTASLKYGGASDPKGVISVAPAQIRLVCKDRSQADKPGAGSGRAYYPAGFVVKGKLEQKPAGEVMTFTRDDSTEKAYGSAIWRDVAFQVPPDVIPVYLQFKLNAMTALPKPVQSTDEIETELDAPKSEQGAADQGSPQESGS